MDIMQFYVQGRQSPRIHYKSRDMVVLGKDLYAMLASPSPRQGERAKMLHRIFISAAQDVILWILEFGGLAMFVMC
jgi:hypothetical protein